MKRLSLTAAVLLVVTFSLAPFLWSVLTSIKTATELRSIPPTYVPHTATLTNYSDIFNRQPFARYMLNSLIVGAGSTALALAAGALAAYALTRLRLRAAGTIEKGLLLFSLFPAAVLIVPLFALARTFGLINSFLGLILVHAALNLPFAIWMLSSFFREFPTELEEAARVDGFSRLQILTRIVLPISAPAIGATAILVFIFSWNEFVISNLFLSGHKVTVPVAISRLSGASAYEIPWGQISAAVVLTTLPVVAAVLAFQRWIISGLTAGAVKG
ncbi:MAG: carbohydrate ABC transporter permease [Planctomycetes bacterium]|nr:carbohydrate ABC transporter permease [Planctomycetota bacterium]